MVEQGYYLTFVLNGDVNNLIYIRIVQSPGRDIDLFHYHDLITRVNKSLLQDTKSISCVSKLLTQYVIHTT